MPCGRLLEVFFIPFGRLLDAFWMPLGRLLDPGTPHVAQGLAKSLGTFMFDDSDVQTWFFWDPIQTAFLCFCRLIGSKFFLIVLVIAQFSDFQIFFNCCVHLGFHLACFVECLGTLKIELER